MISQRLSYSSPRGNTWGSHGVFQAFGTKGSDEIGTEEGMPCCAVHKDHPVEYILLRSRTLMLSEAGCFCRRSQIHILLIRQRNVISDPFLLLFFTRQKIWYISFVSLSDNYRMPFYIPTRSLLCIKTLTYPPMLHSSSPTIYHFFNFS